MRRMIPLLALGLVALVVARVIVSASNQAPAATVASVDPHATPAAAPVRHPAVNRGPGRRSRAAERKPAAKVPTPMAMRRAWRFALRRAGVVSVAVVDTEGKLRGRKESRRYPSASVVKAMLLAAEVRRLKQAGRGIDATTDSLLTAMITRSDNAAADAIYARVGDSGLFKVARRAEMKRFTVAGYWGNAQITAADMAGFFGNLDRAFARKFREYAKGLLGSVIPSQSWGIPAVARPRWDVRFKGGWLPDHALVHQAAELREQKGDRELSMAILTDSQPSHDYGVATVRGVAERLLRQRESRRRLRCSIGIETPPPDERACTVSSRPAS